MQDYAVRNFKFGVVNNIEPQSIPDGAASDSLNWLTKGDKIELRRGSIILGTEIAGVGRVTGLHVAYKADGTEVWFGTHLSSVYYYDTTTSLWVEIGTNILGTAASGEDVSFANYATNAGAQVWFSSPNSSLFKVMVANPGSYTDMYSSTKNFKGHINIHQNRMWMWGLTTDKTGVYGSYVDTGTYTTITNESLGAAGSTAYTGTLAFKAAGAKRTCFGLLAVGGQAASTGISAITAESNAVITSAGHGLVAGDIAFIASVGGMTQINNLAVTVVSVNGNDVTVAVDSSSFSAYTSGGTIQKVEKFTDDYNGNLVGSSGGTGTINYTTGAFSITFNAATVGIVSVTYQWENSNANGISDFTKSATRLAGQGFVFRQDDGGGEMKSILTLGNTEYCFHEFKTWALTLTETDTNATNFIFRQNVGIPYLRAAVATGVGVFYIDVSDRSKPLFRKLYVTPGSSEVLPRTVTLNVNLEGYTFDKCSMVEWNDYVIFTGATSDSSVVNRTFCFHKTWESIDILDYYPSCLAVGNGALICGESISRNFLTIFSGFEDSDSLISNYWEGNISELGLPGEMKKVRRLILEGEIQTNQRYDVYEDVDRGGYVLVGSVEGTGSYVDTGTAIMVGSNTVGSREIGGGGDGVEAYHYLREIHLRLGKFENRKIKIVATGLGYVSVSKIVDHDINRHTTKIPLRYRTAS